jgi:hypothetical protein
MLSVRGREATRRCGCSCGCGFGFGFLPDSLETKLAEADLMAARRDLGRGDGIGDGGCGCGCGCGVDGGDGVVLSSLSFSISALYAGSNLCCSSERIRRGTLIGILLGLPASHVRGV